MSKYSPATINSYYQCSPNSVIELSDGKATLSTLKYFGTTISIDIFNTPNEQSKNILCKALNVIQEYHYLASNYSTYPHVTNIKSINNEPSKKHPIDPKLTELISESIRWHDISHGYFNIALSPVIDLWRQHRFACMRNAKDCSIPDSQALTQAAKHTDISQIQLNIEDNEIQLAKGMSIDLGGIAKGWMAEKVYQQLKHDGVSQFMINAGGNIRHYGLHPQGRLFTTAIEDPICKKHDFQLPKCNGFDGQYHEVIQGEDLTIVSSGNYLRYFEVDGKQYHHLIDPHTLAPKPTGVATTVIMNDNQIMADVLSTMLFLMPVDEALDYVERHDGIEAVWYLDEQGHKKASKHFKRYSVLEHNE
ncbi:FAD:protein FMN transferase [Shewanella waksmanii]|uniref:FAD:protein FMN transferase n=1 Tax=Shewanella waksmanii TaxID=213783 RepID=UPI00373617E0